MKDERGTDLPDETATATLVRDEAEERAPLDLPIGAQYEIEFPARIEAVGPLCAFLNMVGDCHGLSIQELQCVEIAAYESALNIIEHAYGFDPEERIMIRIHMTKRRVCLSFIDRGSGINPEMIPPPDVRDPRVRRRGRGFGLQIIRKSMNRMRYRRTADGRNQLFLLKILDRGREGQAGVLALRRGDVV